MEHRRGGHRASAHAPRSSDGGSTSGLWQRAHLAGEYFRGMDDDEWTRCKFRRSSAASSMASQSLLCTPEPGREARRRCSCERTACKRVFLSNSGRNPTRCATRPPAKWAAAHKGRNTAASSPGSGSFHEAARRHAGRDGEGCVLPSRLISRCPAGLPLRAAGRNAKPSRRQLPQSAPLRREITTLRGRRADGQGGRPWLSPIGPDFSPPACSRSSLSSRAQAMTAAAHRQTRVQPRQTGRSAKASYGYIERSVLPAVVVRCPTGKGSFGVQV